MSHMQWEAGTQPWVRREGHARNGHGYEGTGFATCYFCGHQTAKLSGGDVFADTARIEVYCDSQVCEAREVTILVTRDGSSRTLDRADVRVLRAIDGNKMVDDGELRARTLGEILDDPDLTNTAILDRRRSSGPVQMDLHGDN